MKSIEEIKSKFLSHEAVYCNFTEEKCLNFDISESNDIVKGTLIFHPKFGVYKVTELPSDYTDDEKKDEEHDGKMVLLKTVEQLVEMNKILIITKHIVQSDVYERNINLQVDFYLYDSNRYVNLDINNLLKHMKDQIIEKTDVIDQLKN